MYRLVIVSDNGSVFKNGLIDTNLHAIVYSWDDDVTDQLDDNQFIWTRVSADEEADQAWNTAHAGGTKSIHVTAEDVYVRATFYCDLIDRHHDSHESALKGDGYSEQSTGSVYDRRLE